MSDGMIQLIIGPMFAGKSSELLRRMKRFEYAKKKCIYIKHSIDDRYEEDHISTHDKYFKY
jgi:thymidine kinase